MLHFRHTVLPNEHGVNISLQARFKMRVRKVSHGVKDPVSLTSMKSTVRTRYNVAEQLVLHEASERNKAGKMCKAP